MPRPESMLLRNSGTDRGGHAVRFITQLQLEKGPHHRLELLGGVTLMRTRGATAERRERAWNYEGARSARGCPGGPR